MRDKPPDPSSSPSSSGSSPPDPSLERLLGAIARALDGLVQGNLEIRKAFNDLYREVLKSEQRTEKRVTDLHESSRRNEKRIADLHAAVDKFVSRVDAAIEQQKIVVATAADAKKAIDESRQHVHRAVGRLEDVTGKHAVMVAKKNGDDEEEISWEFIKVRPRSILLAVVKYGPTTVKIIGVLVAFFGSAYALIKRLIPLVGGWH